jgi:hypothetical protein
VARRISPSGAQPQDHDPSHLLRTAWVTAVSRACAEFEAKSPLWKGPNALCSFILLLKSAHLALVLLRP